jgi:hypothetical protein
MEFNFAGFQEKYSPCFDTRTNSPTFFEAKKNPSKLDGFKSAYPAPEEDRKLYHVG